MDDDMWGDVILTPDKLERLRLYLAWYTTAMKDKPFRSAYIDAFAGSGTYIPTGPKRKIACAGLLANPKARKFDGSPTIALRVEPRFDKYIFIEKSRAKIAGLKLLRKKYPHRDIRIKNEDANKYLRQFCKNFDRTRWRAVLFLDPFGTQVDWTTIKAVAQTRAIDLWCLFPLGVAVKRMLPQNGQKIRAGMIRRLDRVFGSHEWYDAFYKTFKDGHLMGEYIRTEKVASLNQIGDYYVNHLRSVFADVARRPLRLDKGNMPRFWLCFAAGDKDGASERVRIAEIIIASLRVRRGT